jgi:hypothetical protein
MPFSRAGRPGLLGSVERTAALHGAQVQKSLPPDSPTRADRTELADQLSQLARLRSAGLLTEAEFTAAKSRLLM